MTLRDLDEFLVDQPIELPIRGKVYRFPGSISARTGLLLQRIAAEAQRVQPEGPAEASDLAREVLSDAEETDLRGEIMGDTEAEMAADGLTTAHTAHAFKTLMVWHMAGPEAGQQAWEQVGPPPAPNRAARRASSVSGSATRSPASTRRTSTRGSTQTADRVAARRGPSSSPSGD